MIVAADGVLVFRGPEGARHSAADFERLPMRAFARSRSGSSAPNVEGEASNFAPLTSCPHSEFLTRVTEFLCAFPPHKLHIPSRCMFASFWSYGRRLLLR